MTGLKNIFFIPRGAKEYRLKIFVVVFINFHFPVAMDKGGAEFCHFFITTCYPTFNANKSLDIYCGTSNMNAISYCYYNTVNYNKHLKPAEF